MKQTITAPTNRAVRVTVYEPAQRADQEEVRLDEFELKAGESREYDFQSATAAFRTSPLTALSAEEDNRSMADSLKERSERMQREDEERLKTINRGAFAERTQDEINAGEHAAKVNKKAYGESERRERKAEQHSHDRKPAAKDDK